MNTTEPLSRTEQRTLLCLARASIQSALGEVDALASVRDTRTITPALRAARGVFVTLKVPRPEERPSPRYVLRGCIGSVTSHHPLFESVIDTAPRSALEDPRFPPLTVPELVGLWIEISALTPMQRIDSLEELVIGRDGLELSRDGHRAIFLPQVGSEQGWQPVQLAEHLAVKAGLAREAWDGAELRTFRAEIFHEE